MADNDSPRFQLQKQFSRKVATEVKDKPTFVLVGDVWMASNQVDTTLDMKSVGTNQSIQLCACVNVKVTIPEKVLSVALISCQGVELDMKSSISGMELTNCENIKVRVKSMLPSAAIDKCQQIGFWITKANAEAIMLTSCKSGDMNVNVNLNATGNPQDDEWVEIPVHEQFEHRINPKMKMETKPSMLYG